MRTDIPPPRILFKTQEMVEILGLEEPELGGIEIVLKNSSTTEGRKAKSAGC